MIAVAISPIMSRIVKNLSSFSVKPNTRWKPAGAFVRMVPMMAIISVGNVHKVIKIK